MTTDNLQHAYQAFGRRLGAGVRPALLIVDYMECMRNGQVMGCEEFDEGIRHTEKLLSACRKHNRPIVHIRTAYAPDDSGNSIFSKKGPVLRTLTADSPLTRIVNELAPLPGEYILTKERASGFFGTMLFSWLKFRMIDTVLVAGNSTSGCIRATVIDACSYNFRPILVRECVRDRDAAVDAASAFDIEQKYGDFWSLEEAEEYLQTGSRKIKEQYDE